MKKFLLNILPVRVKKSIISAIKWMDLCLVKVCAKNGRLSSFYYLFFSRRFDREHLAVLRGRLSYEDSLREIGQSSPLLRRNIHRLEKGLIMQPRRPLFAEAFILETVRCYQAAREKPGFLEGELQWAQDVIGEYFTTVGPSPIIDAARAEYESGIPEAVVQTFDAVPPFKPYPVSSLPDIKITFVELKKLFTRRRSTRWYQNKPVPDELIQKTIEAASLAPSACNRQPFHFVVANGRNAARKIADCAGGTTGFAQQLPAVIVVVGDLAAYPFERDRHLIYIDASLASMQLMLAAETLGLATCPINWPDVDSAESRLHKILSFASHQRVIMLIAIGFAELTGGIPYSQ
ncbi:MAG: nitroreductase family protein, partial [Haliea sp.]